MKRLFSEKVINQIKEELRFELKQAYLCNITKKNTDRTVQAKSVTGESIFEDVIVYNGSLRESEQVLVIQVGEFDYIGLLLRRVVD